MDPALWNEIIGWVAANPLWVAGTAAAASATSALLVALRRRIRVGARPEIVPAPIAAPEA